MKTRAFLQKPVLLSPKNLCGACVVVLESTAPARSKALCCDICRTGLDNGGLAIVGKKGVLAAAVFLSNEPTKHRAAALDLLVAVGVKMNRDLQKLCRICGGSLSDKARDMLQERWKSDSFQGKTPKPEEKHSDPPHQRDLAAELPKLELRTEATVFDGAPGNKRRGLEASVLGSGDNDPFTFSFDPVKRSPDTDGPYVPSSLTSDSCRENSEIPSGAAATLRERLQKIRDKGKSADSLDVLTEPGKHEAQAVEPIDFDKKLEAIRQLLERSCPIPDHDKELASCIETMNLFHGAVSKKQYSNSPHSLESILDFRQSMIRNVDSVFRLVRR